jgi:hypothetical protein
MDEELKETVEELITLSDEYLKQLIDSNIPKKVAELSMKYYVELMKTGFNINDAFELTKALIKNQGMGSK